MRHGHGQTKILLFFMKIRDHIHPEYRRCRTEISGTGAAKAGRVSPGGKI
jgi:hypothetical protein